MCGRFTLFATPDDLGERFSVDVPAEYTPRYNIAPGQAIAVVANDDPEQLQFRTWGLLPSWADDPDDGGQINARAETVEERPSFRSAVRSRRCLIPADGFYEWSGERGSRQPYRIASEDDRPFAMAGIWERWEGPRRQTGLGDFADHDDDATDADGDPPADVRETVAILTTEAVGAVADVHDRMPVILPRERERDWLGADDAMERAELLSPFQDVNLRAYRVSTAVNDPSNDAPELAEPIEG